ncbi:MAG: hypothetical protein II998_08870 [Clostridia bacterium]|nr:hypothetical protein [Clostridia bacterium]
MKKMTNKLISFLCVAVMIISLIPTMAGAARVGDVVGYAQPTDIVATINGYQLQSYNVNGLTYICVEDLRHYGFDVYYDNYSRTLSVNRNWGVSYIDPQVSNTNYWSIGTLSSRKNILYTDISTYVNGSWVNSANINGQTIINFNVLSAFGEVVYDNGIREISLEMPGVAHNPVDIIADVINSEGYYDEENWTCLARAKGDVLMLYCTNNNYGKWSTYEINNYIYSMVPQHKDMYRTDLAEYRSRGMNVSSIYIEDRQYDGTYITSYQVY